MLIPSFPSRYTGFNWGDIMVGKVFDNMNNAFALEFRHVGAVDKVGSQYLGVGAGAQRRR
jgi:hypothetical protein